MEFRSSLNNIERLRVYLEYITLENDAFRKMNPIKQKNFMIMILLTLAQQLTNEIAINEEK